MCTTYARMRSDRAAMRRTLEPLNYGMPGAMSTRPSRKSLGDPGPTNITEENAQATGSTRNRCPRSRLAELQFLGNFAEFRIEFADQIVGRAIACASDLDRDLDFSE
jgi:hypothetical protein